MKSSLRLLIFTLLSIFILSACDNGTSSNDSTAKEVRILAWVGYEEPEIVEPFEKEFGI
uniref:Spermidine/putrescine transport system substrate-binding protein n=1 Tax=Candidatus Kentrum sp. LPFa TaxID=2126335 RepID=A0A450WNR1_9GAMM|nr:MAG: hypothetical protein BECKLPF1236A_GA0070988_1020310 [Candidatus Kentron sp. LPFa]VFK33027.1 MAG: hypothetical protein BECKLPF1236C_GA0070990_1018910 [Candidatus Kentron sp. LPFa]